MPAIVVGMKLSIAQLSSTIKTLVAKGDDATGRAEWYFKAAGAHLRTLKEQIPIGATWERFVKAKCKLSRERADELIRIADGRTTLEKVRAGTAKRMQEHRAKRVSRDTGIRSPLTPEQALVVTARVNAERAKSEASKARAEAVARLFPPPVKTIPQAARAELIAALRMLAKSRDTAAVLIERQRARLNLDWSDLLVPSNADESTLRVGPAQRPFRIAPAA
jgi:hypothetical protein